MLYAHGKSGLDNDNLSLYIRKFLYNGYLQEGRVGERDDQARKNDRRRGAGSQTEVGGGREQVSWTDRKEGKRRQYAGGGGGLVMRRLFAAGGG